MFSQEFFFFWNKNIVEKAWEILSEILFFILDNLALTDINKTQPMLTMLFRSSTKKDFLINLHRDVC